MFDKEDLVIIIDSDITSAKLTKEILFQVGVQNVRAFHSLGKTRCFLETNEVELIIIEKDVDYVPSAGVIKERRANLKGVNAKTPVLMIATNASKKDVANSRDAGASEFLLKPFNIITLRALLEAISLNPRNFIISRSYSGPDRRRKTESPPEGNERRKSDLINKEED